MKRSADLNKHQQKTEAMRRKLLKSAQRIFSRDGFEAARIEDIASAAGHTRGAFYAHFDSKEDLFFALFEQQGYEHAYKIQSLTRACRTAEEQRRVLREYFVRRAKDRGWSVLMLEFKLFALRHPALRSKLAESHRRVREAVESEIKGFLHPHLKLTAPSKEARRVAAGAILHGLVLEQAYDPKTISRSQLISILRQVFDVLAAG